MMPDANGAPEVSVIGLGAGSASVALHVADPVLADALARATAGLRTSVREAHHIISVRRHVNGWHVRTPHCGSQTFTRDDDARDWVEWAACESLLALQRTRVAVHAAAARSGDGAVVVFGDSGAGKSALALAWCLAGHGWFGDDAVLLDADGVVHPFRRMGKVDRDLAEGVGVRVPETPFWCEGNDEVWIDPEQAPGAGWASPCASRTLAWVRWVAGQPVRIEFLPPGALVARAMGQLLGGPPPLAFEALTAAARGAATVSVTFGSAPLAARALADYRP